MNRRIVRFLSLLLAFSCLMVPLISATGDNTDVYDIEIASGAEYDGYILHLKDGVVQAFSDDSDIDTIYAPENMYTAPNLDDIRNAVDAQDIEYIEPNYFYTACNEDYGSMSYATVNDPRYSDQWGLKAIRGEAIWTAGQSVSGVVVGVIDSGLRSLGHEDINSSYIRTGYNYQDNNTTTDDETGHGTGVTSIIAATRNNSKGMASFAYGITIVPLKVLGFWTGATAAMVMQAIYDATDIYGCHVINMSIAGSVYNQALQDACTYAKNKNVILIAAVGNDGDSRVNYPAGYSGVIGVGATTIDGVRASFSNYNATVDVVAPGSSILMADKSTSSSYKYDSGTSYAAPYVTAMAAVAKGYNKNISYTAFLNLLINSSVDKGTSGYDTQYGYGLVDCGLFYYKLTGKDFFTYTDVSTSYWAYSNIIYCTRYNIMNGISQYNFNPTQAITRADFITALGRMHERAGGSITNKNDSFTDTVKNTYYSKYVAWGSERGIINGYGDGRFGPNDSLTREQMALMLYRYAVYTGAQIGTINQSVLNQFTDNGQISSYARDEMAWCVQKNLISGVTTTTIQPTTSSDRSMVATVINRYSTGYSLFATTNETDELELVA